MEIKKIIDLMLETKVIPLFYESDKETARKLVDACYEGGARVIEFTNRGAMAIEVFTDLLNYCNENYPSLALGIGSIADANQANQFMDLGAHFLVSPFIDEEIAKACAARKMFWTGGCATLTEMNTAHKWGVPLMKAFPGNILGPAFIKGAKAPCPWLKIMPTGGVKPEKENLRSWFDAGASCVGMGSRLFVKNEDGSFDYNLISELLKNSIQIANS
ncbi:MAG: bifunctional 4-hydroxy-2-oxoglutarate aldolase/2-dehydro-3-deoxy-phosphogluconate aldolase [Flavobacteriales bacterium]